jgi:hypothetical protein
LPIRIDQESADLKTIWRGFISVRKRQGNPDLHESRGKTLHKTVGEYGRKLSQCREHVFFMKEGVRHIRQQEFFRRTVAKIQKRG